MGIGPLNLVTIQVHDWDAAVRWSTEMLGLGIAVTEPTPSMAAPVSSMQNRSSAGDHPEQRVGVSEHRVAPGFQVGDLDATLARLSAAGVKIDPVIDGDGEGYRLARIWDPEGNRLHPYCYT